VSDAGSGRVKIQFHWDRDDRFRWIFSIAHLQLICSVSLIAKTIGILEDDSSNSEFRLVRQHE